VRRAKGLGNLAELGIRNCIIITVTHELQALNSPSSSPMPFICNIRAARLIAPHISGRYSATSLFPRRLASFYNVNIAGLTEEQVEVCQFVHCEKTTLGYNNTISSEMLSLNLLNAKSRRWRQKLTEPIVSPCISGRSLATWACSASL